MPRFLFSAGAIFVLVLSMCLLPQTAAARRCPVKEPETLLSLYQNSDAIYIASFDKTVDGDIIERNDDYTSIEIKKHFTISATLKGENRKFFALEDRDYRYQLPSVNTDAEPVKEEAEDPEKPDAAAENEPAVVEEEEEVDQSELKNGDTLLLFIKNGDDAESPQLTDYRDGIKKLPMEKIGVYEARINDLNSIFSAKKVSEQRILEWLIRCAEDPVTRWEGTFELLRSVRSQKWRDEAVQRRKSQVADGQPVEEAATEITDEENVDVQAKAGKFVDAQVFAKMLDANHKQTLANILLNFASADGAEKTDGKTEYISGNRELIELVSQWGDPRLVGFLLDQIRAGAKDPSETAEAMELIAEILDNEDVTAIAEKYSETAYEDDDDAVENTVEADEVEAEVEPPAGEIPTSEPTDDQQDPALEPEVDSTEKPEVKKLTYKELRSELLQKFLAECNKAVAEDSAKSGKSAR